MITPWASKIETDSTPRLDPLQLLKRADILSRDFAPEERADILLDLAAAAVPLEPSQAKAWLNQLLHISQELLPGEFRSSVQKNALCLMVKVDADRAASLWKLQGAPDRPQSEDMDIRSDGTAILFPALWKAHQSTSVKTIEDLANWLGSTGQYPYVPVAEIMQKLAATDGDGVEAFYWAGISHLRHGKQYESTNRQFVKFILKTRNLVKPYLLKRALKAVVRSIERTANAHRSGATTEYTTVEESMTSKSQAEALLLELLPTISEANPRVARRLLDEYPSLRDRSNLVRAEYPSIFLSGGCEEAATQNKTEEACLRRIRALAANDPEVKAKVVLSLRDRDLESIALAKLASGCLGTNEEVFASWVGSVNRRLENMRPRLPKLTLMVALCTSYISRKRFCDAIVPMHEAFSLGQLLFGRYVRANSGALAHGAPSFLLLSELVGMAARSLPSPYLVTSAVEHFFNDTLRARMLVVAAAAITNRPSYTTQSSS